MLSGRIHPTNAHTLSLTAGTSSDFSQVTEIFLISSKSNIKSTKYKHKVLPCSCNFIIFVEVTHAFMGAYIRGLKVSLKTINLPDSKLSDSSLVTAPAKLLVSSVCLGLGFVSFSVVLF